MGLIFNNEARSRFELKVGEALAFADYQLDEQVLTILHVFSPPELRGTGVAAQLMQGIVDLARKDGMQLRPVCSYAEVWMARHPEHGDLLAPHL